MQGICAEAGVDAIDVGCVPTPLTYFAAYELGCHSCVSVTGSHNPPDYNGLKMVIGGETLALDAIQQLKARIEAKATCSLARAKYARPIYAKPTWRKSSAT
jgi:phosphomannomutase/phosphoglucomutase